MTAPQSSSSGTPEALRADEAMYKVWNDWHSFYTSHFRSVVGLSYADQMAFYEIAQPIMRSLAALPPQVQAGETKSAPVFSAPHNPGERLPSGDAAKAGAGTNAQAAPKWPKEIRSLVNEIAGIWDAFELGLRQEISNTNYIVVREKLTAVETLLAAPQSVDPAYEAQIKYMVDRFLGWKLPESFNPDGGISFKKTFNDHTAHPMKNEPTGTNLFDAIQADAMVRYMTEGVPRSTNDAQAAPERGVTMLELLIRAGYDASLPHPQCFKGFSYLKLAEMMGEPHPTQGGDKGEAVAAAVNRASEFDAQDIEYARDLLGDLDDDYPDNETIVAQWFRKVRTETILAALPAPPAPLHAGEDSLKRAKDALFNIARCHGYRLNGVELNEAVRAVARALSIPSTDREAGK